MGRQSCDMRDSGSLERDGTSQVSRMWGMIFYEG